MKLSAVFDETKSHPNRTTGLALTIRQNVRVGQRCRPSRVRPLRDREKKFYD